MHFLINAWNHNHLGQLSLQDGRQLEALGHSAQWCNDGLYVHAHTCNILFEGFAAEHIERMRQCKAAGGMTCRHYFNCREQ